MPFNRPEQRHEICYHAGLVRCVSNDEVEQRYDLQLVIKLSKLTKPYLLCELTRVFKVFAFLIEIRELDDSIAQYCNRIRCQRRIETDVRKVIDDLGQ